MQTIGYTQDKEEHIRLRQKKSSGVGGKYLWTDETEDAVWRRKERAHDPRHTTASLIMMEAM